MTYNTTLAVDVVTARKHVSAAVEAVRVLTLALEVHRYALAAETINSEPFQNLRMELRTDFAELERIHSHLERLTNLLIEEDGDLSFAQSQVQDMLVNIAARGREVTRDQASHLIETAVHAFNTVGADLISWDGLHDALFDYTDDEGDGRVLRPGVTVETVRAAVADALVLR